MSIRNLDRLLEPTSVVVVGASDRIGSVGATVWRNLRAGRFAGPIFAVNPKHAALDAIPVFGRVCDLPLAPDLAVLFTPPQTVPGLVQELGALAGIRPRCVRLGFGRAAFRNDAAASARRDGFRPRLTGINARGRTHATIDKPCRAS